MECILATNYFQYRCYIFPCISLEHLGLTDGPLWVVAYFRVTMKLGWRAVAKTMTQHDGLIWAKNEHTEKSGQDKPLMRCGRVCVSLPAKSRREKALMIYLYYLGPQQQNSLKLRMSEIWINPRCTTVVFIKKKISKQTTTVFNSTGSWSRENVHLAWNQVSIFSLTCDVI